MKILIVGAGGVGGYFGGKLSQAGYHVTFMVRGKTLEAISQQGLQVKSIYDAFHVNPKATNTISEIGEIDLIILGVKSWQVETVAQTLKPLIKEDTMVLPQQNGADNADRLREILPHQSVLAGFCKIGSKIEAPGVINHFAFEPEIVFGEYDNTQTKRLNSIHKIFTQAQIKNTLSKNIHLDIWKKFLFIATVSNPGALTRSTFGIMREDQHIRNLLLQTAQEIKAVANAKEIGLTDDDVEMTLQVIDALKYDATASMQRDIMEGRPSELENFNGYILKMGEQLQIPTPINAFTYYCLLPQETRARNGA